MQPQQPPSPPKDIARPCSNCGVLLPAPLPRFCSACGQETNIRPPKLGEFVQQFGGAYLATEGALWRTLKLLLFKPGELTRRYLAGQRKHFVLPLRLYLTISLISLLALRITTGMAMEQPGAIQIDTRKGEYTLIGLGAEHNVGMKDGVFFCQGFPNWLCKRLQRRMDVDNKALQNEIAQLGQRFVSNTGVAMFAMLPLFALLLKLAYWNRRLHYTEHLVFALHLHAFWFVALLLLLPDQGWLSALAFAAIPVYAMLALRRVYGGRWWPRLLRGACITLTYFVVLMVLLVLVALWSVVF